MVGHAHQAVKRLSLFPSLAANQEQDRAPPQHVFKCAAEMKLDPWAGGITRHRDQSDPGLLCGRENNISRSSCSYHQFNLLAILKVTPSIKEDLVDRTIMLLNNQGLQGNFPIRIEISCQVERLVRFRGASEGNQGLAQLREAIGDCKYRAWAALQDCSES